jgi:hypothetical protein
MIFHRQPKPVMQFKPSSMMDYLNAFGYMISVGLAKGYRPSIGLSRAIMYEAAVSVSNVMLRWTEYRGNFAIPGDRPQTMAEFMGEYACARSVVRWSRGIAAFIVANFKRCRAAATLATSSCAMRC